MGSVRNRIFDINIIEPRVKPGGVKNCDDLECKDL